MRNNGVFIGDKLKHLCLHNPRNDTVYHVDQRDFSTLLTDMFESEYKIFDYPDNCKTNTDKQRSRRNKQKTITAHIDNTKACEIEYIKKYCHFFGCSSDYLLGLSDRPTKYFTDVNKKTGLSDDAIKHLLADSEIGLVCNSLLETNSIKDLVEYIETLVRNERVNSYVLNSIYKDIQSPDKKKLYGITLKKYKEFQDTLEYGEKQLQEATASVCIDKLCKDKKVLDYFQAKILSEFRNDAESDITLQNYGGMLKMALQTNNKSMAEFAEKMLISESDKKKKSKK